MQRETLAMLCWSHLLNQEAVRSVYLMLAKHEPQARPFIQDQFAMILKSIIVANVANVVDCSTLAWNRRLFGHCLTTGLRAFYCGERKLDSVFSLDTLFLPCINAKGLQARF